MKKKINTTQKSNGSFYHNPQRNWKKKNIFYYLKEVFSSMTP